MARAAEADISMGKYIRQCTLNDERPGPLIDEVHAAVDTAEAALAKLGASVIDLDAAEKAARQRARDEFYDLPPKRFAALLRAAEQAGRAQA